MHRPELTPLQAVNEIRKDGSGGQVVLVLQGGGALGAYQGGVYQALHEAGIEPDWLIGTSIGAINASIIAGKKPEDRLGKLEEFWRRVERLEPLGRLPGLDRGCRRALLLDPRSPHGIPGFFETKPARLPRLARAARGRSCRLLFDRAVAAGRWKTSSISRSSTSSIRGSPSAPRMCAPA